MTPEEALEVLVENAKSYGNESFGQSAQTILDATEEAENVLREVLASKNN